MLAILIVFKDHKSDVLIGTDRSKVFHHYNFIYLSGLHIKQDKNFLYISKVNIDTQNHISLILTQTDKTYVHSLSI